MEALLIVEVEGSEDEIEEQLGVIEEIARGHDPVELRRSTSEAESAAIWLGRKSAFGAMGQINDYMCLDGTIPVSELPRVLRGIRELSGKYGLDVGNVFHAGDGNMHPLILFDANKPGDLELCEEMGAEILQALRRGRWLPDGRARRRHRETRSDERAVQRRRPRRRSFGSRTCSIRSGC